MRNLFLEFISFIESKGFKFVIDFNDKDGVANLKRDIDRLNLKLIWSQDITDTERDKIYVYVWLSSNSSEDGIVSETIMLLPPENYKSCGVPNFWEAHLENIIKNAKQQPVVLYQHNDPLHGYY